LLVGAASPAVAGDPSPPRSPELQAS